MIYIDIPTTALFSQTVLQTIRGKGLLWDTFCTKKLNLQDLFGVDNVNFASFIVESVLSCDAGTPELPQECAETSLLVPRPCVLKQIYVSQAVICYSYTKQTIELYASLNKLL